MRACTLHGRLDSYLAEDSLREQKKPAKGRRATKFIRSSEHSRRAAISMRCMDRRADGDDWRELVEEATAFYAHSVEGLEGGT